MVAMNAPIFVPMAVLALWTLQVLLLVGYCRVRAGMNGQVLADDFRMGESERVPESVRLPNRNFMNLMEVPVLFYLASLVAVLSSHADGFMLGLAWAYVALRIGHSVVHLSYNHVPHRLALFALSNLVVAVMWFVLLYRLLAG